MFFTISSTKPKASRTKKGRASNASRLSTKSNFTAVTESVSIAETEANQDETMMSTIQPTKSGKGGKKATKAKKGSGKAKGKVAKTKQEEPQIVSSFLELEDDNFEVKVAQVPPPTTPSKKRKSDETSTAKAGLMDSQDKAGDEEHQPPPKKKRATKTSSSVAPIQELPMSTSRNEDEVDTHMTDAEEIAPPSVPASKKKERAVERERFPLHERYQLHRRHRKRLFELAFQIKKSTQP